MRGFATPEPRKVKVGADRPMALAKGAEPLDQSNGVGAGITDVLNR
jgi:hypothetical protein